MALPATMVWEVRPTNGTTNGSGGWAPGGGANDGADFSQQDAVQFAYTDLVIGASNTVTSAGRAFSGTAATGDVGNTLAITGGTGFTTGIYHITDVVAGVATLDRSPGTLASSGGTASFGGARKGFAGGTTTLQSVLLAGHTVHVKNEAWNEAVAISINGSAGSPITVNGYNTARGDNPTGSNRPTNDRATAGTPFNITGTNHIWKNIVGRRGSATGWTGLTTSVFINCKSDTNTTIGFSSVGANLYINCEANNNTTSGWGTTGATQALFGCYSHDNTTIGISSTSANGTRAINCIIEANASHGLSDPFGGGAQIINCTIDGNTGASSDGINTATPVNASTLFNTILSNNGRYGINATVDADSLTADYNDYFGNGTAARAGVTAGPHDLALDPQFVDRTGGNFFIGGNLRGQGWPGGFPGGLSTGYPDMGAVMSSFLTHQGGQIINNAGANRASSF